MDKIKKNIKKMKGWSLRRKIFAGILVVFLVFGLYKKFGPEDNSASVVSTQVSLINLSKTVLATGQITSKTDLALSFSNNGIVKAINVSVGDKVYKGKILAYLSQGIELSELTRARAAVAQAEAKYKKLVEGSSQEEINLAKVLLENAKQEYENTKLQQDLLVSEAENQYLSSATSSGTNLITVKNDYETTKKNSDLAITQAQSLIDQRQAELDIKLAKARNVDLDLAQADILSAQGDLEAASTKYENTLLRAPSDGTITSIDIKVGELAQSQKGVMILQDIGNLYVEANINEANIALLQVGQNVKITYDSLGPNESFAGTVASIDPSSNSSDGVVNYKIKVSLADKDERIRPGMNANIVIDIFTKENVLVVPFVSVKTEDGISKVKLITNEKRKLYKEIPVTVGVMGDGNLIEIQSGLAFGDSVVVTEKK